MNTLNLAETMEAERQRLNKVLETIAEKRIALDQEERSVTIELHGIAAYLDAKLGKVMQPSTVKKRGPQTARGPRQTGIRERVLEAVTVEDISKQDILNKLGAADDKAMQQAVSNALVALKVLNKVKSGERGMYKLNTTEAPQPTLKRVKKEEAPVA